MTPAGSDDVPRAGNRVEQLLDELVRLHVIGLRDRAESQTAVISTLLDAGFDAPRIADLIGTSAGTVRAQRAARLKAAGKGGAKAPKAKTK